MNNDMFLKTILLELAGNIYKIGVNIFSVHRFSKSLETDNKMLTFLKSTLKVYY